MQFVVRKNYYELDCFVANAFTTTIKAKVLNRMGYIKQLDSIRAIAVLLVIIWHWVPRTHFITKLHAGGLGVDIFFVLSGFLITQILLDNRNKTEARGRLKKNVLKNFYVRRVLRIFPIYYLTIAAAMILNHRLTLAVTKNEILSDITYTSNFYIYLNKIWPAASPHFWSLAVEEQFYLMWPLLILFSPKKYLTTVILGFITIGIISQLLVTDYEFGYLLTNTCFDCLGTGGLLAFVVVYNPQRLQKFYRIATILSIIGLVVLVLDWQLNWSIRFGRFIHAILTAWIISHILIYKNKMSLLVRLLSNRLFMQIGKVSYGIYLYHILYLYIAYKFWYRYIIQYLVSIDKQYQPWIFLVINFVILYFICWLSWRFIEKPLLSLKHKFKYQEK